MYSRKIVGYDLSDSLELKGCVRALKKAIYQAKDINSLFTIPIEAYSIAVMYTHKLKK